jgi:chromate transporter
MTEISISQRGRMAELVRYFLRLGFLGFGGPVALVGEVMP